MQDQILDAAGHARFRARPVGWLWAPRIWHLPVILIIALLLRLMYAGWAQANALGFQFDSIEAYEVAVNFIVGDERAQYLGQPNYTDSEYALAPLRRQIPIVAINNSEVVVTEFLKHQREAHGVRSHFWFVEFADYFFHRRYCDLVLSPHPLRTPTRHPKFRRIGLIVRRAVRELAAATPRADPSGKLRNVVLMLSGSVHATPIDFAGHDFPFAIQVVGQEGTSRGPVTYRGRVRETAALLHAADALVINGGYSALSEACAFRRPTFVLPVSGHAERSWTCGIGANTTAARPELRCH